MKKKRGKISLYYSHDIRGYNRILRQKVREIKDIKLDSYKLSYKNGKFVFFRLASKDIKPEDPVLFINAGIHGEETAGPLTILNNLKNIFSYARKNKVKLIIYPLCNPSGFAKITRFNIDGDEGIFGNSDYLRYKMVDGTIKDDIRNNNNYKAWYWSTEITKKLPLETKMVIRLLKKEPLKQIKACLDIHQDYISNALPSAYHYSFGDLRVYKKIISKIKKIVLIYKDKPIDAGFGEIGEDGDRLDITEEVSISDKNGFVVRHDGTMADLFYRLGTSFCITTETMGSTPLKEAMAVNNIWIKGLIDLIASSKNNI
jgi:hypothetical protein